MGHTEGWGRQGEGGGLWHLEGSVRVLHGLEGVVARGSDRLILRGMPRGRSSRLLRGLELLLRRTVQVREGEKQPRPEQCLGTRGRKEGLLGCWSPQAVPSPAPFDATPSVQRAGRGGWGRRSEGGGGGRGDHGPAAGGSSPWRGRPSAAAGPRCRCRLPLRRARGSGRPSGCSRGWLLAPPPVVSAQPGVQ